MSAPLPAPANAPIGPGRLILVVGPSGAGKDAVIAGAKALLNEAPDVVFPRRIVTRPATTDEDHDSLKDQAFGCARDSGLFAFWWEAHGLKYALPRSVEADIAAGRTVVCNVSRGIVDDLRARYTRLVCVEVTAPTELVRARLAGRGRDSDGPVQARLERNRLYPAFSADVTIENAGSLDDAVKAFTAVLLGA